MDNEPDAEHQELSGYAQARLDALKDVVGELGGAVDDADGFAAAVAALRQIGKASSCRRSSTPCRYPITRPSARRR